jgi:hypothetical protein
LLLKIIVYSISHSDITEEAPEVAPDVSGPGIVTLEAAGALASPLGLCALSKEKNT